MLILSKDDCRGTCRYPKPLTKRVIELDLPAPLLAVLRVPPRLQDRDLAAGQDDRQSELWFCRPEVFAGDAVVIAAQQADRRLQRAFQVLPKSEAKPGFVSHLDGEVVGSSVDQEGVRGIEASAGE